MNNNLNKEKLRILLVDDDEAILNLLSDVLSAKYIVKTADSSEKALHIMMNHKFDVMIIDIFLPVMNGKDLVKYIKKHFHDTPVIMISGKPSLDLAVELTKAGAIDVLEKPLDLNKLFEKIEHAVNNKEITQYSHENQCIRHIPEEFHINKIIFNSVYSMVLKVTRNDQIYAMKVLKYENYDKNYKKRIKRFFREAEIMREISHPNIVKIHDFSFNNDTDPYILMDYIPNSSLDESIISSMDMHRKFITVYKIADALRSIHNAGILHRDIKPSNIMIDANGEPLLSDFGIAGMMNSSLTMTDEIVGSPKFMPPEAYISLKNTDERSDIFSFGILCYIIYTNQHPFKGETLEDIIHSVTTEKPIRPTAINSDIPKQMENIIGKMLEKRRSMRFQNIDEIIVTLDACKTHKFKAIHKSFFKQLINPFSIFHPSSPWVE
jgi:serine/threonine protein kinase